MWEDAIADRDLVRRAIEERRFILTRDKKLTEEWSASNILVLESDDTPAQLAQIARHFDLKVPARLFTRCLLCNTPLERADEKEISVAVASRLRQTPGEFYYCPHCRKIYWEGSHTARMREEITKILG